MKKKEYYTPQEIADIFEVKVLTVYRWIKTGKLEAVKIGQWRISEKALNKLVNNK